MGYQPGQLVPKRPKLYLTYLIQPPPSPVVVKTSPLQYLQTSYRNVSLRL
jgi:hypothetical protein